MTPVEEHTLNDSVADLSVGRVLYVWQSDYPWDVRAEKVCAALTDDGFKVSLAARNRRGEPLVEVRSEATVRRLAPWRFAGSRLDAVLQIPAFFSPRWFRLISGIARRERPHVIIVRDIPLCPTAITVGRLYGIPVILDMAENYPGTLRAKWAAGRQQPWDYVIRNPRLFSTLEDYCIKRVGHIMVVIEESAERLAARGVARSRIDVVSNTPPVARALEARGRATESRDARLELVYLGIHTIERGLLELIDAVKILRDRGVAVRATIVGKGRDTDILHAHAGALGLTGDDVVFTGYLQTHAEALAVVAAADVGVIPSRKTPQSDATIPNKLFDYMAAGLPVLTSDTAPCTRIVRETGAGAVFRAGDAADLAAAICSLADPAVRQAAGEAGRRAVKDRYNWERDAAVLRDVVRRVAASRHDLLRRSATPQAAALSGGKA